MSSTARGQRTRMLIMERTAPVFGRMGFSAATLTQLVSATGLTRGAFYFHFDSKDALAEAIVKAQAERWPKMLAQIRLEEPDPLRGLIRLELAGAGVYFADPVMRAAGRLIAERSLIRGELPPTFPWWVEAVSGFLIEAAQQGDLVDLTSLHEIVGAPADAAPEPVPGVRALAEYLIPMWTGVQQAAAGSGRGDMPARIHFSWALLLPAILTRPERCAELLALVAALAAELRREAARPA